MRVCIHRGASARGGNCVEFEADGRRLVVDVGAPVSASRKPAARRARQGGTFCSPASRGALLTQAPAWALRCPPSAPRRGDRRDAVRPIRKGPDRGTGGCGVIRERRPQLLSGERTQPSRSLMPSSVVGEVSWPGAAAQPERVGERGVVRERGVLCVEGVDEHHASETP
jgi:hypothetical protein